MIDIKFVYKQIILKNTWILLKFNVTLFRQEFRESKVFTKENTKELIWRNFLWVTVNFSFFHTATATVFRKTSVKLTFHWFLLKHFIVSWYDVKTFLCGSEFLVFPRCGIAQCGNYRNLLALFFRKNFVKVTLLL